MVTDAVPSEVHSFGSDFVGNPGKCAVKVDVFGVVFPRDVDNHPPHSCINCVYLAFHLYNKRPGFTTIEEKKAF